ncbi:MAG: hypothetical protein ABI180_01510 [Microcoleus sp.]
MNRLILISPDQGSGFKPIFFGKTFVCGDRRSRSTGYLSRIW